MASKQRTIIIVHYGLGENQTKDGKQVKLEVKENATVNEAIAALLAKAQETKTQPSDYALAVEHSRDWLNGSTALPTTCNMFRVLKGGVTEYEGHEILLKTLEGRTISLKNMLDRDTILMVKRMVEEREGIPVETQRLIFAGNQLLDFRTLSSYGVQKDTTLHLVVAPKSK